MPRICSREGCERGPDDETSEETSEDKSPAFLQVIRLYYDGYSADVAPKMEKLKPPPGLAGPAEL